MSRTAFGTFGRKLAAWAVLALVVIIALKMAIGIVAGLVMAVLTAVAVVALVMAAFWAIRRL